MNGEDAGPSAEELGIEHSDKTLPSPAKSPQVVLERPLAQQPALHPEVKLDNLTTKDFTDLAQRFNKARLELAQTNKEAFDKLGNLPIGALINSTTNGGNEKSQAAYAQVKQALDEAEGVNMSAEALAPTTEKQADQVKPIDISQINQNSTIERRKMNPNNISLKQQDENVQVYSGQQEWYQIRGKLEEIIAAGKKTRIVFTADKDSATASYEPIIDSYTVGPSGTAEFKKDPEAFMSDLIHEKAHERYMSLDEKSQKDLNDAVLNDPNLNLLLRQFATVLYSDQKPFGKITTGEHYLSGHDVNNESFVKNTLTLDGQKGLKDARSISFVLNGQQREIFLGALITEFISYQSAFEVGMDVYNRRAALGESLRQGNDPRQEVILRAHTYLNSSPEIKTKLEQLGLFNQVGEFKQQMTSLLQKPPQTNSA
ncbi:MAG: hypothetical protein Q7S44_01880 [bacterium]|nr:hypothetical protein [bacterium]